jgi:hypothetical protein
MDLARRVTLSRPCSVTAERKCERFPVVGDEETRSCAGNWVRMGRR